MADNALGTLFGEIADAIRSKTGDTATMKPSEFPEKISGIEAGGGSVEGVHFVTFMSEDGTTELYKRAVADGDDCADPVERGLIDEPTKESTAQYSYTHVGWSATAGGALDENILKAVTADKTVYVNFAAVLRYYTITYYDSDGTTVLKTESLAYGATPSYEPEKNGYALTGWVPEIATVTGEASYVAQWVESSEISDDWATIAQYAEAGTASSRYHIGDTKEVVFTKTDGTTMAVTFVVADFDRCTDANGNTCGIQFIAKGWFDGTDDGITYSSNLDDALYDFLPSELKSVIKSTKRATADGINVRNYYLFRPWRQEISTTMTGSTGTNDPMQGTLTMNECTAVSNPTNEALELFENMTLAEIAEFFAITAFGNAFVTGGKCYYNSSNYPDGRVGVYYNATYGLIKSYTASNKKYTMCFCV